MGTQPASRWHKWQLVADLCRYGQHQWAFDRDCCCHCGLTGSERALREHFSYAVIRAGPVLEELAR